MKNLYILVVMLLACTAELKSESINDVQEEEYLEPVGIMPDPDCRQISIGDKACNFRLADQDGDTWDLYSYEGDVILLDFSTIWCYPCQVAGLSTQSIQDEYAAEGFQFVTVILQGSSGQEPTEEEIDSWVNEHDITTAPILRGSNEKMIDSQEPGAVSTPGQTGYLLNGYPTYIYIDRNMLFYSGHVGFSEEHVRQTIEEGL